ncbi:MAG: hypothetical protein JWN03_1473 [Nocardia sp.]|nr:hypothetical protein [Nocardia sp.]
MSSSVSIPNVGGELRAIKYEAAHVFHYGANDKYSADIPACVSFRLGDARVALTVSDARDLLEALPSVLAQDDYAEYVTFDSKAVA